MDECLRVLKESNKSSFDSYSVWNNILIISHTTFRHYRVLIFSNSCKCEFSLRKIRAGLHLFWVCRYIL